MPRWLKYLLLISILLLIGSIPLAMQIETGSIQGTIADDHAPLAKATVEARNVMTGAVIRTESDIEGHYRIEGLRAGRYSLWVQAAGHDSMWIPEVVVQRGGTARKDVNLVTTHPTTSSSRLNPGAGSRYRGFHVLPSRSAAILPSLASSAR